MLSQCTVWFTSFCTSNKTNSEHVFGLDLFFHDGRQKIEELCRQKLSLSWLNGVSHGKEPRLHPSAVCYVNWAQ